MEEMNEMGDENVNKAWIPAPKTEGSGDFVSSVTVTVYTSGVGHER